MRTSARSHSLLLRLRRYFRRPKELDGSAVIETVIVLAVIVAIALIFNTQIRAFANRLFDIVFNDDSILDALRP